MNGATAKKLDVADRLKAGNPVDPFRDAKPMAKVVTSDVAPKLSSRLDVVDWSEIRKPLPPVNYVVDALSLSAGAASCIAGYGNAKKTISTMALAVSMASGLPLWGTFKAKRGRVLHLDHEQGFNLTARRYQRLARGMGIDKLDELDGQIKLATYPRIYLSSPDAYDAYMHAADGVDLVVIDSLRAAAPDVDENSSEIRRVLDQLATLSEKSGALYLFIHHASKPKRDDPDGAKYKLRGSGAIFDACASVFVLVADGSETTMVHHAKNRERGVQMDPFGLVTEDVEIDGDPRGGLRVRHLEPEQVAESAAKPEVGLDSAMERIVALLHQHQGRFAGGKNALFEVSEMGRSRFFAAMSRLEALGQIRHETTGGAKFIVWRAP